MGRSLKPILDTMQSLGEAYQLSANYTVIFYQQNFIHDVTFLSLEHRWEIGLFLLFTLIFAGVFMLYGENPWPVWYGALLCLIPGAICGIIHFFRYRQCHNMRMELAQQILILTQELPKSQTLLESDYQEIVSRLQEAYRTTNAAFQSAREDGLDYYTTWVHQIKTPISVMRMLLREEDTPQNHMLEAELFRIEQYVDMALCYIRLDSDTSDFVFREVPLDPLIRRAVRRYAPQFIQKKIRLDYHPTTQTALTDEKWLGFVLEQLLANAVKYTEQGSVSITVTEDQQLCVQDTGIGIAAEDLPRIFEKGFTGWNGRAGKKSTGLGLYLCQKTVNQLGHTIHATSEIGVGSRFVVELKRAQMEMID